MDKATGGCAMPSIRRCLMLAGVLVASVVGCVLFLNSPPPSAEALAMGLDPAKLERLDALVQDAVEGHQIAGAVIALARHGRIGHLKAIGWRDAESQIPMTNDTLFRLSSLTKPITSVAVMMLIEEGKLGLDDPVWRYIPEFKSPTVGTPSLVSWGLQVTPARRDITIRDLLTNTSGLTYRFWDIQPWASLYKNAGISDGINHSPGTSLDNVRRLARQPLMFQPGSFWGYGLSTDVLGVVVEIVSGKDLQTFYRERIFEPLKMQDTYFYVPEEKKDRLAALYVPGRNGKIRRVGDGPMVRVGEMEFSTTYPCEKFGRYFSGGAGLVSTTPDYARFLQMLLNGGELDGVRLLRPETIQQMTTNQIRSLKTCFPQYADSFGFGFGVLTVDGKGIGLDVASIGTYTWGGLFQTYFWVDPKKDLIGVLLVQLFMIGDLPLRQEFKKRAYDCLVG
jgi:CubicO group peptidase (beta-lactamase class C family)